MQLSMLDGLRLASLRRVLRSDADRVARSRPVMTSSDAPPVGETVATFAFFVTFVVKKLRGES
jgi:hypothetical protein